MGTEDFHAVGGEVIGIILHEGGSAWQVSGHDLHGADEGGGFPIAFGGEAESVGHESLSCEAGELWQSVEVFEGGGESFKLALFEEFSEAEFSASFVEQGLGFGGVVLQ
ncbi:MAG: hypothetical protein RI897_3655 [Verrucomicrobiota bacterium]